MNFRYVFKDKIVCESWNIYEFYCILDADKFFALCLNNYMTFENNYTIVPN